MELIQFEEEEENETGQMKYFIGSLQPIRQKKKFKTNKSLVILAFAKNTDLIFFYTNTNIYCYLE